MNKYNLVVFNDEDLELEVKVDSSNETVWLTQKQMELLFNVSHATISEHINNIFLEGELEDKIPPTLSSSEITIDFLISEFGKDNVDQYATKIKSWMKRNRNKRVACGSLCYI